MDWVRIVEALSVLTAVGISLYTLRATRRKVAGEAFEAETSAASKVTDAALALLEPLQLRIASLEQEVVNLRCEVEQARKDEAYYEAQLHTKDLEIEALRDRVRHLEDVLVAAGLNGDQSDC